MKQRQNRVTVQPRTRAAVEEQQQTSILRGFHINEMKTEKQWFIYSQRTGSTGRKSGGCF